MKRFLLTVAITLLIPLVSSSCGLIKMAADNHGWQQFIEESKQKKEEFIKNDFPLALARLKEAAEYLNDRHTKNFDKRNFSKLLDEYINTVLWSTQNTLVRASQYDERGYDIFKYDFGYTRGAVKDFYCCEPSSRKYPYVQISLSPPFTDISIIFLPIYAFSSEYSERTATIALEYNNYIIFLQGDYSFGPFENYYARRISGKTGAVELEYAKKIITVALSEYATAKRGAMEKALIEQNARKKEAEKILKEIEERKLKLDELRMPKLY